MCTYGKVDRQLVPAPNLAVLLFGGNMETEVPFSGFYNTIHDQECDHVLDSMFSDSATGCYPYESLRDKAFDLVDWRAVHYGYAKAYVEGFSQEFEVELDFKEVVSPKYYNFETDRLFAVISLQEVERLFRQTNQDIFKQTIKDRFTSRSGFISYYPNDLSEWPSNLAEWDVNHVGTLLYAHVMQKTGKEFGGYEQYELVDNAFEVVYNLIDEHSEPGINRLHSIRDYLDRRAERTKDF